ncbi:Mur ligase family protein [Leucobacter tenebrionis]|uniref:Mur ligase family protein n=1 Tax=Leucobacter tenebrionis TaxID=2873270 RepID=UPI001CA69DDA|nr:UDP-N-acetylmuramoyl-tripeptide--D-alanyl-D-alanine ligase [Leucobacter tenebrionis]QZY53125.1 UDP-N-acetylmuramoyl-tripeptide--D-alanyl-D-alanine ligase [Leucobacter tenebrionis]
MLVSALLAHLRESGSIAVEYRGELGATFEGFSVSSAPEQTLGRCFFVIDDRWPFESSWPRNWRDRAIGSSEDAVAAIQLAFANGASCAVLLRKWLTSEAAEKLKGHNLFVVEDSYRFYFRAGEALRKLNTGCRFTAITGSVGKTSTTAMVAHAFQSLGISTFATQRSQNIGISVFRNISRSEGFQQAVIEVSYGACRSFVREGCFPGADVAVVTAITEAHLANADSLEEIAKVKAEVFAASPPGGAAVICLDAPHADLLLSRARSENRRIITYGESTEALIRLLSYDPATGMVTAETEGERMNYTLGMGGKHNALNSLAVIGVLRAHGAVNWREGLRSLASLHPLPGRGEQLEVAISPELRVTFVNEAYNASPASIRAALEAFSAAPSASEGRRIAVLGDILDLGSHSEAVHRSLAPIIMRAGLDGIILFGEEMGTLHEELLNNRVGCCYFNTLEEMTAALPALLRPDDEVLAKASNATGLAAWISANATISAH